MVGCMLLSKASKCCIRFCKEQGQIPQSVHLGPRGHSRQAWDSCSTDPTGQESKLLDKLALSKT